ncbi:MAG: beta-propeller domain-containing protein [Candidatus Tectomicrobia bacterium]|uniref:Beta-propeller domain-containing protein n=1 Tax=Tectimicrobiota bacterium TaxID=2528274 RepID=A0A932CQB8_UNCTE|nr:beta-propeller domain-containing protein [Candidatus Tectomicrobia bacterium]
MTGHTILTKRRLSFRALSIGYLMILLLLSRGSVASARIKPEPVGLNLVNAQERVTIRLKRPIYRRTILKRHIQVQDALGKEVAVSATMGAGGKSVTVHPPAGGYTPGMTYTVRIRATLRSRSGQPLLQRPILQRFKIAEAIGEGHTALPVVGSYEKLKQLLTDASASGPSPMVRGRQGGPIVLAETNAGATRGLVSGAQGDYSTTNLQVEGVDEADLVKTDGAYLYQVNRRRIVVAQAVPAAEMEIVQEIAFEDQNFYPTELYVDDAHLVVLGTRYREMQVQENVRGSLPIARAGRGDRRMAFSLWRDLSTTRALVYDIANKANIRQVRELELEGRLLSSRKIDAVLYLVVSQAAYLSEETPGKAGESRPSYRDSATGGAWAPIDYPEIHYFPNSLEANYLLIAGLNLAQPEEAARISTYLGAGHQIYVSRQHLYVAASRYHYETFAEEALGAPVALFEGVSSSEQTDVFKFALKDGRADYVGQGQVPGTILNQFSMDELSQEEDNVYFRIATTTQGTWQPDGESPSQNHLYILDAQMARIGQLENIAPGEQIYATRFMGKRLYLVTFRQVDPFFVIDLQDPSHPAILGALKIPGYSTYLHPYDDTHILGFGKETIEVPLSDERGNPRGTVALTLGMKVALFDVSAVDRPVELFSERIGDRGTESELLYNHKALLFSREKGLLAFPVTVMEVREPDQTGGSGTQGFPPYGTFAFQGAYVYQLDLDRGFQRRGQIAHLSEAEMAEIANGQWSYSDRFIQRVLSIGDTLYTLSEGRIMAHDLAELAEQGSVEIPPAVEEEAFSLHTGFTLTQYGVMDIPPIEVEDNVVEASMITTPPTTSPVDPLRLPPLVAPQR